MSQRDSRLGGGDAKGIRPVIKRFKVGKQKTRVGQRIFPRTLSHPPFRKVVVLYGLFFVLVQ